jgi:hypothetical protein
VNVRHVARRENDKASGVCSTGRGGQTGETGGMYHYSGRRGMVDDDGFQDDREIWEVTHVREEDLTRPRGWSVIKKKKVK